MSTRSHESELTKDHLDGADSMFGVERPDPRREAEIYSKPDMFMARCVDAILGRTIAMHANNTSDAEIIRTLAPCVCGAWLITLAKEMRARGLLVLTNSEGEQAASEPPAPGPDGLTEQDHIDAKIYDEMLESEAVAKAAEGKA